MPDKRSHRGAHPEDERLFDVSQHEVLRRASHDLCWLLSRGYSANSALKLVGDRCQLQKRQRIAVARCACSDQDRQQRRQREVSWRELSNTGLWIDGFNVLTSIEAALAGGVILLARDGCCRDMASVHGAYRRVVETTPAIELLGNTLASWRLSRCQWVLDQPVSNSGRLRALLLAAARRHGWTWDVQLVPNPDALLADCEHVVATADSAILDRCRRWVNLTRWVIEQHVPQAHRLDLSDFGGA